jgi:hypothetical protein
LGPWSGRSGRRGENNILGASRKIEPAVGGSSWLRSGPEKIAFAGCVGSGKNQRRWNHRGRCGIRVKLCID